MILKKVLKTLAVLTILPALFLMLRRWWRRKKIRERIMADGESDYRKTASNIANSIAKARVLAKSLLVKIHPDRMPPDKVEKATELAARITESKRNYEVLKQLEIEVNELLTEISIH